MKKLCKFNDPKYNSCKFLDKNGACLNEASACGMILYEQSEQEKGLLKKEKWYEKYYEPKVKIKVHNKVSSIPFK